jgi:hypothetical protein
MYYAASASEIDDVLLESFAKQAMMTSVTLRAAHKLSLPRDMLAEPTTIFLQDAIDRGLFFINLSSFWCDLGLPCSTPTITRMRLVQQRSTF